MKLSGWVRLWIAASVVWWIGGAWWLATNFEPQLVVGWKAIEKPVAPPTRSQSLAMETTSNEPSSAPVGPLSDEVIADIRKRLAEQRRTNPVTVMPDPNSGFERHVRDDWTLWLTQLAGIAVVPFVFAVGFIGLRRVAMWIWRGFRPA